MKKHYYKLLSFFLCFFILLSILDSNSICFASNITSSSPVGDFHNFHSPEETWDFFSDYCLEIVDMVTGLIPHVGHTDLSGHFRDIIKTNKHFETETELYEWMNDDNLMIDNPDNVSNFNELYLSDEFLNVIKDAVNTYKNQCDNEQVFRYKTTYCPDDLQASNFEIFNSYQNCKNKMNELASNCDYLLWWNCGTYGCVFYQCTVSNCALLYGSSGYSNVKIDCSNFNIDSPVKVTYFNYAGNVTYTANSIRELQEICVSANRSNGNRFKFTTNDGTETWSATNPASFSYCVPLVWSYNNRDLTYDVPYIFSTSHDYYKEFKSLADYMDFYANTYQAPYYQTTPSISGNIITAQQLNNGVNYGDIVGGNKYIITPGPGNYITPITDPGSGGGGGGGTDPITDPGSGGGGGGVTIPDFSGLLSGLFKLIEAIFNLFSSVIGKIAELVASLITSVTNIMNSLLDLFNNNAIGLLGNVLSFLPTDVTRLITLTFSLGCLIAIIKFFRG